MSGAVTDIRDVLGIDGGNVEPRQAPLKKQKTFEKRPGTYIIRGTEH